MKKCQGCSTENDDDATYCKKCSKKIGLTQYQKGDYWGNSSSSQKPSSEQINPNTRQYAIQQYRQYINYHGVFAPSYHVKVQNIYYVVKSSGYNYQCPRCGYSWRPTVQNPSACPGPGCHVKYGWKVRAGIDLRPWLIPLGVSVEFSK